MNKKYKPFNDYKKALYEQEGISAENFKINSKLHEIFLLKQSKIVLDGTKMCKRLKDPDENFKTLPL